MNNVQVKVKVIKTRIKAEVEFDMNPIQQENYKEESDLENSEIEIGDIFVKTEEIPDLTDYQDNDLKVGQDIHNDLIDDIGSGLLLSSKQLKAMSKYSAEIGKDLKTKIIKNKNNLSCRICGFTKSSLETMRGHLSKHRPGNPFQCPIKTCAKISPTHAQLTQHIKTHYPADKPHRCNAPSCSATFRAKHDLIKHKRTHSNVKKFQCRVPGCGKKFALPESLRRHGQVHLKREQRVKLKCPEPDCGLLFLSKVGLYHHARRHKGIYKERKYSCFFCKRTMDTPSAREIHLRQHTLERPFKCEKCDIWLCTKDGVQRHDRVHIKTDPFVCSHCPKQFKWSQDLKGHLKTMHNENAPMFQCIHCSYQSVRIKDLQKHERRIHLKLRPYRCSLCPKTFAEKQGFKIHMKMHGTSRPFKCDICGKGFVTQPRLNYHVQTHSDEKRFPCPKCDNKYKTNLGREMHLQLKHGMGNRNRDVQCYFCPKIYHGLSGYLKHLRNHTLEKPYKCTEPGCSEPLMKSQEILVYHLQTKHGKGKPRVIRSDTDERFKCQECTRTYKYKPDLTKHVRITHDKTAPIHNCPKPGCGYKTANKNCIRQHMKVHLNVTYKCKTCPKRYKRKKTLTKHSKLCF